MAAERNEKPTRTATDHELLFRFVRKSDEPAFEEIVRRHGAMVLGVCRRVLGNGHDAEDAFQATFFVLAKSARKIRKKGALANWLYGVAYRVALKEAKRKYATGEEPLGEAVADEDNPFDEVMRRHDERVDDEELYALADKYRRPLTLHYLAGRTVKDIAGELGLSVSAVEGRLKRAKTQLRRRLVQRGVMFSVLGTVIASTQEAAQAQVSTSLIQQTVQSSVSYAAGKACGSTTSHQLAQLEVSTMASAAKTTGTIVAATVFAACVGIWSVGTFVVGQEPGSPGKTVTVQAGVQDEEEPLTTTVVTVDNATGQRADSSDGSSVDQYRKFIEATEARLNQEVVDDVIDGPMTLSDFAQYVNQKIAVPVVIDRRALEDIGMDETTEVVTDAVPKGISIRSALRLAFDQADLEYVLTDEVLLITTPEEAENRPDTRVYSTEQLPITAEELSQIIKQTISATSWDEVGGPGTIYVLPEGNNGLVVSQTQRVHEQIADLLEQIRRNADSAKREQDAASP